MPILFRGSDPEPPGHQPPAPEPIRPAIAIERAAEAPAPRRRRVRWISRTLVTSLLFVSVAVMSWPAALGGPITFAVVSGESMEPGYKTGDLLVAVRQYGGYEVGESIVYMVDDGNLHGRVVHRITEQLPNGNFLTRGDNKPYNDPWEVRPEWILGEVKVLIPDALTALRIMRSPIFLGTIFGLFVIILLWPKPKIRDLEPDEPDSDN